MSGLPIKNIRGPYVVFEVEYFQNGWAKRMESTPIWSNAIRLSLDTPINFAFSLRLTIQLRYWSEKKNVLEGC